MEINLPGFQIDGGEIEVTVRPGSTSSLGINPGRLHKKLYKQLTSPIEMNDEYIHDARYDVDTNMAHILGHVVPRLLIAKEICPNITVVLRGKASSLGKAVYNLLGFPVICTDKHVQGQLVMITHREAEVKGLHYLFIDLPFEGYNPQTPERVFISRKGTRCLLNEEEIEKTLQEYGFKKFYFEDIPISEQWSIARNAKVIVGVHGAGMAGIVLNPNKPKVVELMHPGYVGWGYRPRTNAVGGKWCGITGQITPDVIRELDFKPTTGRRFGLSSMNIHKNSLKMALEYLQVKPTSGQLT